ncbi:MAG TPA: hypothetical protein VJ719_14685, partial [Chthoniobacterales bacterium]|nr:hypothetical protein [Chthoniobacterales bacterium]
MKTKSSCIAARATLSVLLIVTAVALILAGMNISVLGRTPRDLKKEAALAKAPAGAAALPPSGILFTHNTIVDFSALGGEPFINSAPVTVAPNTPAGSPFISAPFGVSTTVSLLWKSIDGGRSFIPLGTPIVRDS